MVVVTYGGTIVKPCTINNELAIAGMMKDNDKPLLDSVNKTSLDAAIKITREKILALMLLNGSNYQQYSEVCNALSKQFTQGVNTYPKTTEEDVRLLIN